MGAAASLPRAGPEPQAAAAPRAAASGEVSASLRLFLRTVLESFTL